METKTDQPILRKRRMDENTKKGIWIGIAIGFATGAMMMYLMFKHYLQTKGYQV